MKKHIIIGLLVFGLCLGGYAGSIFATKSAADEAEPTIKKKEDPYEPLLKITPLHKACAEGDLKTAKSLIEKDHTLINKKYKFGATPLHSAIWGGNKEVVEYLVEEGADVNEIGSNVYPPLHLAASKGSLEIVQYLIKNKANVKAKFLGRMAPLHGAVNFGSLDIVKALVAAGADTTVIDGHSKSLRDLAFKYGHKELVEYFDKEKEQREKKEKLEKPDDLEKFEGTDVNGDTPLHKACTAGRLDVVKYFVEKKGTPINVKNNLGQTPLHQASTAGHENTAKYLLNNGATVDAKSNSGSTPLLYATRTGKMEVVELLVGKGADINAKNLQGETPLSSGTGDVAKYLKREKESKDTKTLNKVIQNGTLGEFKSLIEKEPTAYAKDSSGNTPLHKASGAGRLDIVTYLIEEKSTPVDVQNEEKQTPLVMAVSAKQYKVVKYLVKKGANVKVYVYLQGSLLGISAGNGDLKTAKFLVKKGADVNARSTAPFVKGWAPLHFAAASSDVATSKILDVMKFLIEKGAHVDAKDAKGKTPLDLAIESRNQEIINFLKEALKEKTK